MAYLKCDKCEYRSFAIDDPYWLPRGLVSRAIDMHVMAHKNHNVREIKGAEK